MAVSGSKSSSKNKSETSNEYAIDQFKRGQAELSGKTYTPVSAEQIKGYESPYTSSVIDATMARAKKAQAGAINDIGDAAIRAGAFGGDRHGVAEGVAMGEFDLNNQQVAAQLEERAYAQALAVAQGENSAANQMPLAIQALLAQMAQGTKTNTKSSGTATNFGASWAPSVGFG